MNRDIIERANSYTLLGEYLGIERETVKSYFKRQNKDIKNKDDIGNYIDLKLNNRGGVYIIENSVNGKKYIGMAKSIHYRFGGHKSQLNVGTHTNKGLQHDYNLYGKGAFKYIVYRYIDSEEERVRVEKELIDSYPRKKLYNCEWLFGIFSDKEKLLKLANNYDKFMEFIDGLENT